MKRLVPPLALLIAACGGLAEAPEPETRRAASAEVVLAWGQEYRADSTLTIGFSRVVLDSRCAATVVCAWAGDGAVELALTAGGGPTHRYTLHTQLDPKSVDFAGHRITLLELMPYPYGTDPISPDEYAIRLQVERLEP